MLTAKTTEVGSFERCCFGYVWWMLSRSFVDDLGYVLMLTWCGSIVHSLYSALPSCLLPANAHVPALKCFGLDISLHIYMISLAIYPKATSIGHSFISSSNKNVYEFPKSYTLSQRQRTAFATRYWRMKVSPMLALAGRVRVENMSCWESAAVCALVLR